VRLRTGRGQLAGVVALALTLSLGVSMAGSRDVHGRESEQPCGHRLNVGDDNAPRQLSYCAPHPIERSDRSIERLVVVIHGHRRDADAYYEAATRTARAVEAQGTLIVSPRFPTGADLDDDVRDRLLYWSSDGWKQGELSRQTKPRSHQISSFAALDRLIGRAVSSQPALRTVVIAGHSAGGQFVNRYAAGSTLPDELGSIDVRFVVANPSSYLYLDGRRPRGTPMEGVARPSRHDREHCPGYDRYKYGLEDLNAYLRDRGGGAALRARYASRQVTYLLGQDDRATDGERLDRSCAAELQGRHRLERGISYFRYLGVLYGTRVYDNHSLVVIPGVGHDRVELFDSTPGRFALFGRIGVPDRAVEIE
jgi:hypothetical protein